MAEKDGMFVSEYRQVITPKNFDDPLVEVILQFQQQKNAGISEAGKYLRELDVDPNMLANKKFMNKVVNTLNELIKAAGPTTRTRECNEINQCGDHYQYRKTVNIPGVFEFVTGIDCIIKKIEFFTTCKSAGIDFIEACELLKSNKNLTSSHIEQIHRYVKAYSYVKTF